MCTRNCSKRRSVFHFGAIEFSVASDKMIVFSELIPGTDKNKLQEEI